MKICILGWYGTETIGDRAILAGVLSFLENAFGRVEVLLGSLYPFFTERTLEEDEPFYKEILSKAPAISLFNSKKMSELHKAIRDSDMVVMGGGPLEDISGVFMIEYAFKKAKRSGKKTGLLGCGIGPLFKREFRKSVLEIIENSDIIILRDSVARMNLEDIYREFNRSLKKVISVSLDPSAETCLRFLQKTGNEIYKEDYIAINLRRFPLDYTGTREQSIGEKINNNLVDFVKEVAQEFQNHSILLVPNHYFHIGDDDRIFLNEIAHSLKLKNLGVQNYPLNLKETMGVYKNACLNIGMRFHSVVFQTLLNGKNYILDYTEPERGKIYGFIKDVDEAGFYSERYINLQKAKPSIGILKGINERFLYNRNYIKERLSIYTAELKNACKN